MVWLELRWDGDYDRNCSADARREREHTGEDFVIQDSNHSRTFTSPLKALLRFVVLLFLAFLI